MKVKIQQGSEEINSTGGISLIGGLLNRLESIKKQIRCKHQKSKLEKSNTAASSKPLPGCLRSAGMIMPMLLHSAKIRSFGTV